MTLHCVILNHGVFVFVAHVFDKKKSTRVMLNKSIYFCPFILVRPSPGVLSMMSRHTQDSNTHDKRETHLWKRGTLSNDFSFL